MIIANMARLAQPQHRVLVVGGGFGGVRAAAQLARRAQFEVTLLSNHHTFAYYPQFYHSATGGSRSEIALPLKHIFNRRPVRLVTDTAVSIDLAARTIGGQSGATYTYDTLVVALGSVTNYFGIKGLNEYSFDIKSIDGAEHFKRHLHRELLESSGHVRNYVVVGGGPTGIELAASLGHYLRRIARQHRLPTPQFTVDLVEAAPRLLPRMPKPFAERVRRRLHDLGVKVMTGAVVQAETARTLQLAGRTISTGTVVWTAGATNNPFYQHNAAAFSLTAHGRVIVDDRLMAAPQVYVIGDNADTPFSGYAQTAIRDAQFVATDVWRTFRGHHRPSYRPVHPVDVIPVGRHWAAARWGRLEMYGYAGYILRRLADLVGYADIERWPVAIMVWLQDRRHANGCRICGRNLGATRD